MIVAVALAIAALIFAIGFYWGYIIGYWAADPYEEKTALREALQTVARAAAIYDITGKLPLKKEDWQKINRLLAKENKRR